MSAKPYKTFTHAGKVFTIKPRLRYDGRPEEIVRSSIHHVGGLLSPVVVCRAWGRGIA